jgi:zinc transporter ZupT
MLVFFLEVTIFGNFVSSLACFSNKNTMDLAMTFSGGLFLSIALIDVIP